MNRPEQLDSLVDNVLAEHEAWLEYPGDEPPGPKYWAAVDAMISGFSKGAIPSGKRRLTIAVDEVRREVENYSNRDDTESQNPQKEFFYALDRLKHVRRLPTKADLPPLESVAELMKLEGMTLAQVARMYRKFLPNGEPDQVAIRRELETPGSVFPPGYDPRVADLEAEDDDAGDLPTFSAEHTTPADKPCPESPLDLWEQEVSPEQAATMLRKPLAEVVAMFRKFDKDAKTKQKQTA